MCKLGALEKARLRNVHFSGDFLGVFDFLRSACSLRIPLDPVKTRPAKNAGATG